METVLIIAAVAAAAWFIVNQLGQQQQAYNPNAPPGTQGVAGNLQQAQSTSTALASSVQQQSQQGQASILGGEIGIGTSLLSGGVTAGVSIAEAGALTGTAIAGIATAGVGAIAGLAMVLWQKHELRMKMAQDENSAWNIIYPDWSSSIQQLFQAYNAGQIPDGPTLSAELDSLRQLVYADAVRFQGQPGIDWTGGGNPPIGLSNSQKIWQVACTKNCTIGCCLFSGIVGPNTERGKALVTGQPVAVFGSGSMQMQTGLTSFVVPAIPPNTTYGFTGAPAFTLAITR